MRERLTERVRTRLADMGNSDADRLAVEAVDNYYNHVKDQCSDLVAAEACREFADHLMLRAPRMAEAWEHLTTLAQDVEHMKTLFTGAVMSLGVDGQRNALSSTVTNTTVAGFKAAAAAMAEADEIRQKLWGAASTPEDEDALYPEDVITGFEDGCHIVNGDPNSCGCPKHLAGHSVMCEVRLTPGWEHAPTLCNVARTNCNHAFRNSEKHTYGQRCEGDQAPTGEHRIYTGHSRDCAQQGGHAAADCNKHRPACFHEPRHLFKERCRG